METLRTLACLVSGLAASIAADGQTIIPIWDGKAPGSEGWRQTEVTYTEKLRLHGASSSQSRVQFVRNVVTPTLTAYIPSPRTANGSAVVICPGGGFRFLGLEIEGASTGKWFAARGIAAFVLKYRLVPTPADPTAFEADREIFLQNFTAVTASGKRPRNLDEILPDQESKRIRGFANADAQQALRFVRTHADEWGVSRDRIGMLGFSVGGFLVTDVIFSASPESMPNFAVLIHGGELRNWKSLTNAPPLFMAVAQDDRWMSAATRDLFLYWDQGDLPVELHYFAVGGHGFLALPREELTDPWADLLAHWLARQGFMGKANE